MLFMDKEIMSYTDVMDAVRRIANQKRHKELKAKNKYYTRAQTLLYDSILHYLDIHAKRHIQGSGGEKV